ncbi:MAG: hypothetical protein LBG76_10080 [Treponema sp.]|jgi:hypothetical protein|nr:hypothetical protein [Treponema sp.]
MVRKRFVTAVVVLMAAQGALLFAGGQQSSAKTGGGGGSSKVDLGGISVTIGRDSIRRAFDTETYVPISIYGDQLLTYRRQIQKDYNFKMKDEMVVPDHYSELWNASMVAGKPLSEIIYIYGSMVFPWQNNKWLAPLPASIDFTKSVNGVSWSPVMARAMTWGGKTYGFVINPGFANRNKGIMFNKRLLREAGIDPNYPYELQKAGTWTWEKFTELCKKLTQDKNNDGKIDVYGLDQFQLAPFVCSNGGQFVDFDTATGKFVNATTRPEWAEAFNYVQSMKPYAGGNFLEATAAMSQVDENWLTGGDGPLYINFADDWGYVVYPKGPRAEDYYVYARDDIYAIPNMFSAEQVEKFMTALQLWYATPPEAGPDGWKQDQYRLFRDDRAVNETLAIMRNPRNCVFPVIYLTELNEWDMKGDTAQQAVESVQAAWASKLAEYNVLIGK